ncbi:MAG: hypothetical protein EXQ86_01785 [Rhodospirillales bacterium]|nr:hypothetical protein [Rhodospirillales bacterium]
MLEAIRKRAGSIVVKSLFFVLVASFVVWGIGDVVRVGSRSDEVARVGDVRITPAEYGNELRRELNNLKPLLGEGITIEQARAMGISDGVLTRMISNVLIELGAKQRGVLISDELLRQRVVETKLFQGPVGFDRARFQQILYSAGMSEEAYLQSLRRDLMREQYVGSLTAGARAPGPLVDAVFAHREERRIVDVVFIPDASATGIVEPGAETLQTYYKDNGARFTAPEYRTVTLLKLDAEQIAKDTPVSDDEIKEAYESRHQEFSTPARRVIEQFVVGDEERAMRAHALLKEGRPFADVAKEIAGKSGTDLEFGPLARDQMLPELAEPTFALPVGGFGEPIRSPLGWHLVRVVKAEPAVTKTIGDVKPQLRQDVATEKAFDRLFEVANRLEDALGGGANVEEAAQRLGLPVAKMGPFDGQGRGPDGKPVAGLLAAGKFLETAFATAKGSDSPVIEAGKDGYFVLRVDAVTPAALRPFDTVKDQVRDAWLQDQRAEASKKAAEDLAAQVNAGGDLQALAQPKNLTLTTTKPVRRFRDRDSGNMPEGLIAGIFTTPVAQAVTARGADGYHVARVKAIQPADPQRDKAAYDALARQLSEGVRNDLAVELAESLKERFPATINRKALEQAF